MRIIETHIFTKKVISLLSGDEYQHLQNELIINPEKGSLIKGTGGLRKMKWRISGKGKSGGVRVIYYWMSKRDLILMLFIYPKSEQDDLSPAQLKILKTLLEEELK